MGLITADLSSAEGYNTKKDEFGNWKARDGWQVIGEGNYVYGCSAQSPSGLFYHYIFRQDYILPGADITCDLYDSNWHLLGSNICGKIIDQTSPWSHAIVDTQIVVNSPGLSTPLHAYVGSSPTQAEIVPSTVSTSTALDLLPGLVCSFNGRCVWAFENQIYIDEGNSPLTISNGTPLQGQITDLFQDGASGSLVVVTTAGVTTFPPDALGGYEYTGVINTTTHYSSLNYRNAAASRGSVHALCSAGLQNLQDNSVTPLTVNRRPRTITKYAGNGSDWRSGQMFSTEFGYIISFGRGQPFAVVDLEKGGISWWDDDSYSGPVKAVLKDASGRFCLIYGDGILLSYGNNPDCTHGLAMYSQVAGNNSINVQYVWVSVPSDGVSQIKAATNAKLGTKTAPIVTGGSRTQTAIWGTSLAKESNFHGVRIAQNTRVDGIFTEVEIGADQSIQNIQIETKTQSPGRR